MTLQVNQLSCRRGGHPLFQQIDFQINAGEALRIAGANGCGKTSLLRILCGLSSPTEGEVRWKNKLIHQTRETFNNELIYLGHANNLKDDLTAWENIVFTSSLSGKPVNRQNAYKVLERFHLNNAADLPTRLLSQGQRKKISLARLFLDNQTPLWILDEPLTGLDQKTINDCCAVLDQHLYHGGMLIYTTHQEVSLQTGQLHTLHLGQEAIC